MEAPWNRIPHELLIFVPKVYYRVTVSWYNPLFSISPCYLRYAFTFIIPSMPSSSKLFFYFFRNPKCVLLNFPACSHFMALAPFSPRKSGFDSQVRPYIICGGRYTVSAGDVIVQLHAKHPCALHASHMFDHLIVVVLYFVRSIRKRFSNSTSILS